MDMFSVMVTLGIAVLLVAIVATAHFCAGRLPAADAPQVTVMAEPSGTDFSKADLHVHRFSLALAQATDETRKRELRRQLEYWQLVQRANMAREIN